MNRTPAFFPLTVSHVFILLVVVTEVLSQQTSWMPSNPSGVPVQFTPLPLMYQNLQGMAQSARPQTLPRQSSSASALNALSSVPALGGKLRLLSTLFGGLRNSGLESSIAGEILQRLIKTGLRDVLVPFKRDVFTPLLS